MSKFIPIVSTEFLAKATEFATKNDTTNMTAEEADKNKLWHCLLMQRKLKSLPLN